MLGGDTRLHWTSNAHVVSDPPQKAAGETQSNLFEETIAGAMQSARVKLDIVSPYFIPGDDGLHLLRALRDRSVAVTVLTNTLAATDVAAVHGAYANYRTAVLAMGIRLFELKPEIGGSNMSAFGSSGASLHTKAFTVDHSKGFVGSFNFDPRSISLNTEMGVLFEQDQIIAEMSDVFADQLSSNSSYRLALRDGDIVWLSSDNGHIKELTTEPEASIWRRIVADVISFLPLESQL
jgi:putative cardiolipin synthase